VRKWIAEIIPDVNYKPVHTMCAVGIGLYERGLF
ncbi:unnamed protein product, partial [marine sediment metagenome]